MQAWILSDFRTGYCSNLDIYAGLLGKETDMLDRNIVLSWIWYHHVMTLVIILYFDNYYTSPVVIEDLASNHFGACGTLYVSRKEIPQPIPKPKLKAGMAPVFVCQHGILYISWFNKRQVNITTNLHDELIFTKQVYGKPPIISGRFKSQLLLSCKLESWAGLTELIQSFWTFWTVTRQTSDEWKSSFTYLNGQWWTLALFSKNPKEMLLALNATLPCSQMTWLPSWLQATPDYYYYYYYYFYENLYCAVAHRHEQFVKQGRI